jgi:hypothetical protein
MSETIYRPSGQADVLSCGTCRYGLVASERPDWVYCLRNPPSWSGHHGRPGHIIVAAADWCGEYKSTSGGTPPVDGSGSGIGVTDGSDAAPGHIGEFLSASVQPGSPLVATSNVVMNITTLTLPPGDWDLQGQVATLASSGGHIQHMQMWMSPTSATVPTGFVGGFHEVGGIATGGSEQLVLPSGRMRQSLAAQTVIYLSTKVTFTGSLSAYGFISARRVR